MNREQINNIIVTVLSNSIVLGKYQLKKIKKYQKNVDIENVIRETEKIKDKIIKRKRIEEENEKLQKKIFEFKEILKNNFSHENVKNFCSNYKWLKIIVVNSFKDYDCCGIYNYNRNILLVKNENIDDSMLHELFHLASSNLSLKYKRIGFLLNYKDGSIGYGLNEGYTELLSRRYSGGNSDYYIMEQIIAEHLETIVGQEKMKSFYLNSNLYGLINELKKYYTVDEIEKFLITLDIYTCYFRETKITSKKLQYKMEGLINELFIFLIKGYIKFLKEKNIKNKYECILNYIEDFFRITNDIEIVKKTNAMIFEFLNERICITKEDLDYEKHHK